MHRPDDLPPGSSVGLVLILGLLILIGGAITAFAQTTLPAGGDTLEIRPHPVHAAEAFYSNAASQASAPVDGRLCLDDVCVVVRIDLARAAPSERLTVDAENGHIAMPDMIDVPDGEAVRVLILRPMF